MIFVYVWVAWAMGVGGGVGFPCPPIRNDIGTPRHLFSLNHDWSVDFSENLLYILIFAQESPGNLT